MAGTKSTNWNICRICLSEEYCMSSSEEPGLDLSAGSSSGGNANKSVHKLIDAETAEKIFECSGVMVKANDGLPHRICGHCFILLQAAVEFKNICRNSNERLQALVQKSAKATSVSDPNNSNEEPFKVDGNEPKEDINTCVSTAE